MSCKRIRDINQRNRPQTIEIRVLRKWITEGNKEEICYQFVDCYGDAIEATAEAKDNAHFDSIIQVNSCYKVAGYICASRRTYMATVDHAASLVIGRKTKFTPITGTNIPTAYFNFADYDIIRKRIKDKKLLTDYISRVEKNSLRTTSTGITLRKVLLQDERRKDVEITLWPEKRHLIGDEVVQGDIIAITSTTVTEHEGMLQLESTYLTTTIINPDLLQTSDHVNRLKALPASQTFKLNEKLVTIRELATNNLPEGQVYTNFICEAKVRQINTHRPWYYAICSKCSNKLYPEEDNGKLYFVCKDDDAIVPKFKYCVNATIGDESGTKDVVFFDEGMHAMVNCTCEEMVTKGAHTDPTKLPDVFASIIDVPKLLHLSVRNDGKIVVNNATSPIPTHNMKTTTTHLSTSVLSPTTPNPKTITSKRSYPETPGPSQKPKVKQP